MLAPIFPAFIQPQTNSVINLQSNSTTNANTPGANNKNRQSYLPEYLPANLDIPLADDGLPLWSNDSFLPLARQRRYASLRRPYGELLNVNDRIGSATVGAALMQYGRILWNIKQNRQPRVGLAVGIRQAAVAALGGRYTPRGAEFIKRCKIIKRSVVYLNKMQTHALRQYSEEHAKTIRNEIDRYRVSALYGGASGELLRNASPKQIMDRIECHISASETNWLAYPFVWAWSKIWC